MSLAALMSLDLAGLMNVALTPMMFPSDARGAPHKSVGGVSPLVKATPLA